MKPAVIHTFAFIGDQFTKWTSRKFWLVLLAIWLVWVFYWADVRQIFTFTEPEQLKAFVTLSAQKSTTIQWLVLGYLAAEGAILMGSGIGGAVSTMSSMKQTFTTATTKTSEPADTAAPTPTKAANTKNLD